MHTHVMHLLVYSKFFPLQCNSVRQERLFLFFFFDKFSKLFTVFVLGRRLQNMERMSISCSIL